MLFHDILHISKFRQSRWTHYHRLHSRKLRSVCCRINELKKVPSHVVEGQVITFAAENAESGLGTRRSQLCSSITISTRQCDLHHATTMLQISTMIRKQK